jgi:hypothetical protein
MTKITKKIELNEFNKPGDCVIKAQLTIEVEIGEYFDRIPSEAYLTSIIEKEWRNAGDNDLISIEEIEISN